MAPPVLSAAELVTALAGAPLKGDLAIPSLGVGTAAPPSGLVSSWSLGAAGVGALDTSRPQFAFGKTAGGAPAVQEFSDLRFLQWEDAEENCTPCTPEPQAMPESERVPVLGSEEGLQSPSVGAAAGIPARPAGLDEMMEHFAEVRLPDTSACVTGLEEGAGKAYLLLSLVGGLAAHQGAQKSDTPRPLPQPRGRRPRGW
jgi:hypothetical protein